VRCSCAVDCPFVVSLLFFFFFFSAVPLLLLLLCGLCRLLAAAQAFLARRGHHAVRRRLHSARGRRTGTGDVTRAYSHRPSFLRATMPTGMKPREGSDGAQPTSEQQQQPPPPPQESSQPASPPNGIKPHDASEASPAAPAEAGEAADGAASDTSDSQCAICHGYNWVLELILCDGCDKEYHLACLTPPLAKVPEGEFRGPCCSGQDPAVVRAYCPLRIHWSCCVGMCVKYGCRYVGRYLCVDAAVAWGCGWPPSTLSAAACG
jgi:hypothetical protein